jgi:hypothetical protein
MKLESLTLGSRYMNDYKGNPITCGQVAQVGIGWQKKLLEELHEFAY